MDASMMPINIVPDSSAGLARLALSIHNAACRMPVAVKSRHSRGILVEGGEFIACARECDFLDCLFSGDDRGKIVIREGRHAGRTMFASAVVNAAGQRIAAIGIIDTLGMLSLERLVSDAERVERQLGGRRTGR